LTWKYPSNEENLVKAGLLIAAALIPAVARDAHGQQYPTRPVRLISPFAPGGGTDILSRVLAVPLTESFGHPVVVDNRPGAGGSMGAEIAARAEPDGYTFVTVSSSYTATSAYHKVPYDPVTGIEPVVLLGTTGLLMSVHPSVPARSVAELVSHAKANPGKLNYASVGAGSVVHLGIEQFKLGTGTNIVHLPYKGGGPALLATVAGEAQLTTISMVPSLPHVRAGRLRALGITTPTRMGVPRDIVTRWNREVSKVLNSAAMKKQMQGEGLEPAGGPPEELTRLIRRDVNKWRRVIKEAKITRAE
jgi:tripartite-type tricarboxylate transporter receptor subunit TctC